MSQINFKGVFMFSLTLVLLFASPAYANTMIPAIFATLPAMLIALLPIIAIETIVLGIWLGVSAWNVLAVVSLANVASTLIGIPLTWILLSPLHKFPDTTVLGSLWYMPIEEEEAPEPWVFMAAGLLLLVVYFFASWLIEYQIAVRMLDGLVPQDVNYAVFVSNLATYGILAGFLLGWLLWEALAAVRVALSALWSVQEAPEVHPALLDAEAVEAEALLGDNGIDVAHAGESLIGSTTQEQ